MTHPDLMTLSQLLDGELHPAEPVEAHLASCPACAARVARVREAESAVRSAAGAAPPPAAASPPCPTPSRLVAWLDPAAPAGERQALAGHLESCDACLGDALAAARLMGRLDAAPARPVPGPLLARVASRWPAAPPSLTTVVVSIARRTARLLDRHLVAPVERLIELAAPAAALRAGAEVAALQFELRADRARIRTTVVPAGDAVDVTIVMAGEAGEPLPAHRVSLRRHGRALFSARTDTDGRIVLPALERGVYEVSCPAVATAFRLDLRAAD